MKRIRWFAGLTLLGAATLAWLSGLFYFINQIPEKVDDETTAAGAIVVLTGGSGRIEEGLRLLQIQAAGRLFISGAGINVTLSDITDPLGIDAENLADRISIGTSAADTPGNALETRDWVKKEGITSIRLVTAAYHMPRSLLELRYAVPEVVIIPHPVFPESVKTDWWRYPGTASLLIREYLKYLVAQMRHILISGVG